MTKIRYVQKQDRDFWFRLDRHITPLEFDKKVRDQMGYVLLVDRAPAGLLRYHLLWDSVPFCAMLYVDGPHQGKGYGKSLMDFWEADMRAQGFHAVMTSTRADETAQHFYRKLGYRDCGGLLLDAIESGQPLELFFVKEMG